MLYNLSSHGKILFLTVEALSENALLTKEFYGMDVFKEILADDHTAFVSS